MPQVTIPYGTLSVRELVHVHNNLALTRGVPPLRRWGESHCRLVQRVAILRTRTPIAPAAKTVAPNSKLPKRRQPVRDAILAALAFVAHYEDIKTGGYVSKPRAKSLPRNTLFSVGLPYAEVLARVKKRFPDSKVSALDLRWNATQVRQRVAGFERCNLPQKRPHGMKGKSQ